MFKTRKAQNPVEELQDRVAYLEGVNGTMLYFMSNRGHTIRAMRQKTAEGSVERAFADLMLCIEREAFSKAFGNEVPDCQQQGHETFISAMSRCLRS